MPWDPTVLLPFNNGSVRHSMSPIGNDRVTVCACLRAVRQLTMTPSRHHFKIAIRSACGIPLMLFTGTIRRLDVTVLFGRITVRVVAGVGLCAAAVAFSPPAAAAPLKAGGTNCLEVLAGTAALAAAGGPGVVAGGGAAPVAVAGGGVATDACSAAAVQAAGAGVPVVAPGPAAVPVAAPVPVGAPLAAPVPLGAPVAAPVPVGAPLAAPVPAGAPVLAPVPAGGALVAPAAAGAPITEMGGVGTGKGVPTTPPIGADGPTPGVPLLPGDQN